METAVGGTIRVQGRHSLARCVCVRWGGGFLLAGEAETEAERPYRPRLCYAEKGGNACCFFSALDASSRDVFREPCWTPPAAPCSARRAERREPIWTFNRRVTARPLLFEPRAPWGFRGRSLLPLKRSPPRPLGHGARFSVRSVAGPGFVVGAGEVRNRRCM